MNLRLDKWLWAARFFKTRALAQNAIARNDVRVNAQNVKPSYTVKINDMVEIKQAHTHFQVKVLGLSVQRQKATLAQLLYAETEESKKNREALQLQRQFTQEPALGWHGRPEKKERRDLEKLIHRF